MSETALLRFDALDPEQRDAIRTAARSLYTAMMVAPGKGVNGYTPEEAAVIDYYAYSADRLIRTFGWYNDMFPQDQEIYPPAWMDLPKIYLWELYGADGPPVGGVSPIAPPTDNVMIPPRATPEEPSNTVWYLKAGMYQRSNLIEAASRVVDMTSPIRTGGIQSGDRANTTTTTLNNARSVDWAIWELLLALMYAGYQEGPPQ